jgi:hypothetical protein
VRGVGLASARVWKGLWARTLLGCFDLEDSELLECYLQSTVGAGKTSVQEEHAWGYDQGQSE